MQDATATGVGTTPAASTAQPQYFFPADVHAAYERITAAAQALGYGYIHFNAALASAVISRKVPAATPVTIYSVIVARRIGEQTIHVENHDLPALERELGKRMAARPLI